jgi:homocysteine S-methyltransferase
VIVLDGGLATELEKHGHDLNHDLWSARLLISDPRAVRDVHRSYLEAGSMCVTSASYQATIAGFVSEGLSESRAKRLLMDSVSIAKQAVAEFLGERLPSPDFDPPIVVASIGPYGASLADGSEYRGNYKISRDELTDFHAARIEAMCQAKPDLLACETIPCRREAEVLRDLLAATSDVLAWISFSCADGQHISDGTPVAECASLLDTCDHVFAVGVNCTAPQYVRSLVEQIRVAAPNKRIVVYPNSGQSYDVERRTWTGQSNAADFGQLAKEWFAAGATLIGGCCQTGPDHIRAIRDSVFR